MSTRRLPLRALAAVTLGSIGLRCCPVAAQTAEAGRTQADPAPAWQAVLATRVRHAGVGLAAAVVEGPAGAAPQMAYAGRRSGEDTRPPDAASAFEYGSITKTFTGLLLAQMVLARELALDDAVETVLGRRLRDSAGEPITWLDLATHRSGLPRLASNQQPRQPADPYADYDAARLQAFLEDWKPDTRRQARHAYSNLGFGLLGHALGLRAGQPYAALLRERVLRPLQLDGMAVATTGSPAGPLLTGHDGQGRPVPRWTFDTMAGAGALTGTLPALARYAMAALGLVETPLAAAFELALKRHADADKPTNAMGLGWFLGSLDGRRIANHDGGTYGFSTSLFLDHDRRRAAMVLGNAFVPVSDLALHLLDPGIPPRDMAAEQRQTQRAAVALPAAVLEPLAGTYALNPQFRLTLRVREGRLFAQATGQGEFELFALDERRFFARVTALEIAFEGHGGPPPGLTLLQGGQRLHFVRE